MHDKVSQEHNKFLEKKKREKNLIFMGQILVFISFFLIWEIAAQLEWIDPFIFSQPSSIIVTFFQMIKEGSLFFHAGVTLIETIIGFLFSTIVGTFIAIALWWNKFFREISEPYLIVLNSLPKTAIAPIIIVIFGTSITSIIVTAILTSIIVTIITVLSGFLEVDKDKIKLVETFGGTKSQILQKVVLPASVPTMFNALKINIGLSFVGVIVGEFLVAQAGLGYLIVYGSQIFKMDWVMLSIIILCFMAAMLYHVVSVLERRFIRK